MRTDQEEDYIEDRTLTLLRSELRDLALRTSRIERQIHAIQHAGERAVPSNAETLGSSREPSGGPAKPLQVGDRVRFEATKITKGGTGHIVRIVRNFVIIERSGTDSNGNAQQVQRAPRNVRRIDDE